MTPLNDSHCDFGPPPPCPERFNLAKYVLTGAAADPDKIALTIVGGAQAPATRLTYAALTDRVLGAAAGLKAAGLKPGERIILRIGHDVEFPCQHVGAGKTNHLETISRFSFRPLHA